MSLNILIWPVPPYNPAMVEETSRDPTQRFTDRAENYRKYRPDYPEALYGYLGGHAGLASGDAIADIGSGTGLLNLLFLSQGHDVYGIKPNAAMRQAAEVTLDGQQN